MVQRKDTPAARAALAKRRQRAAQHLNANSASTAENNRVSSTTASAASISTAEDVDPESTDKKNSKNRNTIDTSDPESFPHWKRNTLNRRLPPSAAPSGNTLSTQQAFASHDDDDDDEGDVDDSECIPRKGETMQKACASGGHTVAGQTVDETIATAAMTESTMEHNKQSHLEFPKTGERGMERKLAARVTGIIETSLSKSKSFGTATEESTFGEANIETILRKDRSGFEYVQEVEVRQQRRRPHRPQGSFAKETRERYEPISNFGFVEVTSPQPRTSHERRGDPMQSVYPQPKSPDAFQQQQSMIESVNPQCNQIARPQPHLSSTDKRQPQQEQQQNDPRSGGKVQTTASSALATRQNQSATNILRVPSLDKSSSVNHPHELKNDEVDDKRHHEESNDKLSSPSHKQQSDNDLADNSDQVNGKDFSNLSMNDSQLDRPPTLARRPFQRASPCRLGSTNATRMDPNSLNNAPSMTSSAPSVDTPVSSGGAVVMRKSRIPSLTPINPTGKRPLPQQASILKMNTSPVKQASIKRFNLPPSGRHTSPPKQHVHQAQTNTPAGSVSTSGDNSKLSLSPKDTLQMESVESKSMRSVMEKRRMATNMADANSSFDFFKVHHSHTNESKPAMNAGSSRTSQQSPRVDRLSAFLNDAVKFRDSVETSERQAQQRKDERLDPVVQSRNMVDSYGERPADVKTTTTQRFKLGEHEHDPAEERADIRAMAWPASERQMTSLIEQHRAAADVKDYEQEHRCQRDKRSNFERSNIYQPHQENKGRHQYQSLHHVGNDNSESSSPQFPKSRDTTSNENGRNGLHMHRTGFSKDENDLQKSAAPFESCRLEIRDVLSNDSASIHSGHHIILRSCLSCKTVQASPDDVLARIQGLDLSQEQEILEIVKIDADGIVPLDQIRYGNTVIFRSSTAHGNAFGTRRRRSDIKAVNELGFFDVGNIKSDRWMILPAKSAEDVMIGRAALNKKDSLPPGIKENSWLVQSGAAIILRNCYNGGILSVSEGKLTLLTDSYDSNRFVDSENPTLLGRLQNHNKLSPSISESFQLFLPAIPPCPPWSHADGMGERFFSAGNFSQRLERDHTDAEMTQAHAKLSSQMKEKILIDEVIGSFLGLEGLYIRFTKEKSSTMDKQAFRLINAGRKVFDLSLRHLVEQILPLSTYYARVKYFVASHCPGFEYGKVMQALCEGLDSYLSQFSSFVADLERKMRESDGKRKLTVKSIQYEITPLLHSMSILKNVTEAISETKGGDLINKLWSLKQRVYMGDTVANDLIGTLLDKCLAPYVKMLTNWLQSGTLRDPYDEFMVFHPSLPTRSSDFDGDSWSSLFQVSERNVVKHIFRNDQTIWKVLMTGKYWNAIQACGVNAKSSQEALPKLSNLRFQSDSSVISTYIDNTYEIASKQLVGLLKGKFTLMESLHTMKRYFLLDQGDFFVNFFDTSEGELLKPFNGVSFGRVQHSLSMSIQLTEAQRDGDFESFSHFLHDYERQLHPNSLRCRFLSESLVAYLDSLYGGLGDIEPKTPSRQVCGAIGAANTGFDLFTIDFAQVPFPTSLVLSGQAMESYKLLFRQLFFSKHVERRLVGVWSDHQLLKRLDSLRGLLGPSFLLRQRMLHFVQNLNNYVTFEVIESNWLEMLSAINDSETCLSVQNEQTLDDIVHAHDTFLGKTLDACLLTNSVLIKSLSKLLNTCLLFSDQMKRFMDTTKISDDSVNLAVEKRMAVQRNLNERGTFQTTTIDKKELRRALNSVKEERVMLHHRQTRRVGREVCSDSYKRMVSRFEEVYSADLAQFMMQLNAHTTSGTVANLGLRLDWNGFITSTLTCD